MVTAAMVKELRERTGAGMMDCKKALAETGGDMEKAIEFLREKGLAAAAKKSGRIAAEGLVSAKVASGNKKAVLLEVNCETDFVAKTDEFKAFVDEVADVILHNNPTDVDGLLQVKAGQSTVSEMLTEKVAKIGENISIRRFASFEAPDGFVEAYIHGVGRIGVLVELSGNSDNLGEVAKDVAMQVAASKPDYATRDQVAADVIEKEKEILKVQAMNEGKSENIAEKIVMGRIEKFYKENCLVEQPFIKDTDLSVKQMLEQKQVKVARFIRFEMGEGLEKRENDLAAEVAAMQKKS
ncbi:translation elongation factor Ts [Phosphitispora fastidiosa]|uniref:translation elongation factor Ts n=1 Tax=Phosphitispora fastidiosa TaxID=2837202 RepID=UPI001E5849B1|nr:translation elongation factor Ts [Phosphitispora fastidiosa]MBU7008300.1 elongation factor Ts [Phosphitispora fastidiosa]